MLDDLLDPENPEDVEELASRIYGYQDIEKFKVLYHGPSRLARRGACYVLEHYEVRRINTEEEM